MFFWLRKVNTDLVAEYGWLHLPRQVRGFLLQRGMLKQLYSIDAHQYVVHNDAAYRTAASAQSTQRWRLKASAEAGPAELGLDIVTSERGTS